MTSATAPVPAAVLNAFGLPEQGHAIPGGEGRSFRYGRAVLKPVDDPVEAEWTARLLSNVEPRGFRLPRPLRAHDGRWVVDRWAATEYVAGHTGPAGRWRELLNASRAFHAAISPAPRPAFLDGRTHRWARADRVAWGEQVVTVPTEAREQWARLTRMIRPVSAPSQLIHGDLSGNMLFATGVPPAVIDFSPYWRPVIYAEAVVAIDGMLWFGADHQLFTSETYGPDFPQMLVRALMFRLIALTEKAHEGDRSCLAELPMFTPAIAAVERLVTTQTTS